MTILIHATTIKQQKTSETKSQEAGLGSITESAFLLPCGAHWMVLDGNPVLAAYLGKW